MARVAAKQVIHLEGPDDADHAAITSTAPRRRQGMNSSRLGLRAARPRLPRRHRRRASMAGLDEGRAARLIKPGGEVQLSDAERSAGNARTGRAAHLRLGDDPGGVVRFRARRQGSSRAITSASSIWGVAWAAGVAPRRELPRCIA